MKYIILLGLKQGFYAYFKLPIFCSEFLGQTNSILKMSLNGLRSINLEPYKLREIYHEFVKSIMTDNDLWDITSAELVEIF